MSKAEDLISQYLEDGEVEEERYIAGKRLGSEAYTGDAIHRHLSNAGSDIEKALRVFQKAPSFKAVSKKVALIQKSLSAATLEVSKITSDINF